MMFRFLTSVCFGAVLAGTAVADGAFGLEFGDEIPASARDIGNGFHVVTPDRTHPEFKTYGILAAPEFGVCIIRAIGKSHEDDEWGFSIKRKYEEIISVLEKKYGPGEREEFLRSGALYDELKDFSRAIDKNQRVHQIFWSSVSEGPNGIDDIFLTVKADWTDTYLALQYRSNSSEACQKALMEQANDAF